MKIRYSVGLVALVVACGGSSKHEATGNHDDGGVSGDSSGTSGKGGGDFGATTGVAGTVGGNFGEICNDDGCFSGDPTVTPVEPTGPIHCGGNACAEGEACCMTSGACFDPESNAAACPRPPADDDRDGRRPCASNAHCDELFFCDVGIGELCGGVGHCQPISACAGCVNGGPVVGPNPCRLCGCDGNSYPDTETACRAGVAIAYQGASCGETVEEGGGGTGATGGSAASGNSPPRLVTPCGTSDDCVSSGQLCCAITNRCYPSSDPGQCRVPPEGTRFPCTSNAQCEDWETCVGEGCDTPGGCAQRDGGQCGVILEPACGCDGVTYTSADCATQSGVRVKSKGECTN